MGFNKKFFTTGGIVASQPAAAAAFDPLQNFETVTYTGNGGTQKITGYIRKGAAFNGSSSIITTSLDFDTLTDYSVSMWINTPEAVNDFFGGTIDSGAKNGIYFAVNSDSTIRWYERDNSVAGTVTELNSTDTITLNSWHHIVFVRDGGTNYIYVDNGTPASASNSTITHAAGFTLGRAGNYTVKYWEGKIDQVRIFDKALSSGEVTTLSNETYASSTKSTTDIFSDGSGVALYELDEDANDTAGAGNNGKFGDAAFFNGSSSYIDIPTIPNITGSGSDFSFSAWFNFDGTSGDRYIMSFRENSFIELGFNSGYSPRKLEFKVNDGSNKVILVDESEITYNSWHHVCLTAESSGNLTAYLDGTVKGITSIASIGNAGQQNRIGAYNTAGHFTGRIDDARIYSDILTSQEVGYLYNNTTASIPTDYVAYYKLDGNATDETTNYDGTATNVSYGYNGTPTAINFLGMSFTPDLIWIKARSGTYGSNPHRLQDSVRGDFYLSTSSTAGEQAVTTGIQSYDTNGFTVGSGNSYNGTGTDFVAWCWKAASSDSTNTDGTITSTVRANQDAGFSIVKYTAGGAANVGHGLSSAPELIIAKTTDVAANWWVYHKDVGTGKYLNLNTTGGTATDSGVFSSVSSSTFTNNISSSSYTYINYCFHSVDSYQKVGSYNGGSSGNAITGLGFEPRFLMLKRTDSTGGWLIFDSVRDTTDPRTEFLGAHQDLAESTLTGGVDFDSDGFTLQSTNSTINTSGGIYIYLAIA